jgi:hypothetical protein
LRLMCFHSGVDVGEGRAHTRLRNMFKR